MIIQPDIRRDWTLILLLYDLAYGIVIYHIANLCRNNDKKTWDTLFRIGYILFLGAQVGIYTDDVFEFLVYDPRCI